jgi:hypothetical protein
MFVATTDAPAIDGTTREMSFVVLASAAAIAIGAAIAFFRLPSRNGSFRGFPNDATPARRKKMAWFTSAASAFFAAVFLLMIDALLPECALQHKGQFLCITLPVNDTPLAVMRSFSASLIVNMFSYYIASAIGYAVAYVRELLPNRS